MHIIRRIKRNPSRRNKRISSKKSLEEKASSNSQFKSICFVYDVEGWAFYNKALNLKKNLEHKYNIFLERYDKVDPQKFDLIIYFSILSTSKQIDYSKSACGITSFKKTNDFSKLSSFNWVFSNDKTLFDRLKGKKWYLPNGVDCSFFKGRIRDQKKDMVLGLVGAKKYSEHKGLGRMCKVYDNLLKQGFAIKKDFLFPDVRTKKKTHRDMIKYYEGIDIFLVSSVSEATPNPLLEAMSMGIPCISNNTGMASLLIEDGKTGFLVKEFDDLESYEDKIKILLRNPSLYKEISKGAIVKIQEYDWSNMSDSWIEMIETIFEEIG